MAIIQFSSDKDRELVLSRESQVKTESQLIIGRPQYDFEILSFEDEEKFPEVIVTPPSACYSDQLQFQYFYDFEIKYLDQSFKVNSFLASSLSNKISAQLQNNMNSLSIQSNVHMKGPFNLVCQSLMGHEITITSENAIFLLLCAKDLEMSQLTDACMEFVTDMSDFDLMFRFASDLCTNGLDYSHHVDYITEHFNTLKDETQFKSLPLQMVYDILTKLPAETKDTSNFADWLLSFLGENAEARARLVNFLPFTKIEAKSIRNILSRIGVNMNTLKTSLINIVDHGFEGLDDGPTDTIKCPYSHSDPDSGIFSALSKRNGCKPSKIIEVSSTSDIWMVIDPSWNKSWVSASIPDMWIMFDLDARKNPKQPFRRLQVKSYTLRTALSGEMGHLKSWVLEGANDPNDQWTVLHNQPKCSVLHGPGKSHTFDTSNSKPFRYIRLRMTGKNWADSESLCLQCIEFFGEVFYGEDQEKKEIIKYDPGKEWNGYFDWLKRFSEGNPIFAGEIAIDCASSASNIVDSGWNGYWRSPDTPNSFVIFKFPNMSVSIDMYFMQTYSGSGNCYPQTWVVEGSNDGLKWDFIDQKSKVTNLKGSGKGGLFACKPSEKFKMIRIKQNGENNAGQHSFMLSHVEFYGRLFLFQ